MTLPDFDPQSPEMPEASEAQSRDEYWQTEPDDESGDPPWAPAKAHPHPTKEETKR